MNNFKPPPLTYETFFLVLFVFGCGVSGWSQTYQGCHYGAHKPWNFYASLETHLKGDPYSIKKIMPCAPLNITYDEFNHF